MSLKALQSIFISSFFTASIFSSTLSIADDTEIFYSRTTSTGNEAANVLLMFDNSGSMLLKADSKTGVSRIESVRQATINLVNAVSNVNIGMGSFGGRKQGGTIRYPVVNMDKDVCENLTCDSISLVARVENTSDDAEEAPGGEVFLDNEGIDIGGDNTVGLRFENIRLPRGAVLQSARLRVTPTTTTGDVLLVDNHLNVNAEAIAHSPPLTAVDFNLTGRTPTTNTVTWIPPVFLPNNEYTVDVLPVVSEVVGFADWCGGNALTLLIDGPAARNIYTSEKLDGRQAMLQLAYDPASVDFNDTCLSQQVVSSVAASSDDAVQNLSSGVVDSLGESLNTQVGGELNLIALKFNDMKIPQASTIVSAELKVQSAGYSGGKISANIYGEYAANSSEFDASLPYSISSRTPTGGSVNWDNIDQVAAESFLRSPDITPIVQEIVDNVGWDSGNNMTLMLEPSSAAGELFLASFDGGNGGSALLSIQYQVDETTLAGNPVVLKRARDELIDEVLLLSADSFTPIVDMLYEATLYYRGEPVHYGKTRGEGVGEDRNSIQRVSHKDSYTGGVLFQPPGCSDVDLSNVACLGETITGTPVYQAPEAQACIANNIVLLTDGAALKNTSKELVKTLTGVADCAMKGRADEECGVELANWLNTTDQDTALVGDQFTKVHTIGFGFSSDFIKDLAIAGAGQFHPVENTNSLTNAFREIATSAADITTSYVAPTVAVSQLNTISNSDEIYYAMFRPQVTAKWDGNLKRYALSEYAGETAVVDALGSPAIDASTGAISANAQSYWSGAVDGSDITEGGAASKLALPRNVLTFQPGATGVLSLEAFHEDNVNLNAAALGLADDSYFTELVQWSRGVDVKDKDNDGNVTEVRTEMGDPLHSTPHVIHYAGAVAGEVDSTIFVGTNEGFLHGIDAETGVEEFAIIPPELLPNLDIFYKNEAFEENKRTYGLDGDIVGWVNDTNGNRIVDGTETAFVVVGMRRGGRNYYAFNVSDPANPEVAWVIKNTDPNFAELGETWSRPIKSKLKVNGAAMDVLIFSGGYDSIGDTRTERSDVATSDLQGRAIYIVNAETGALVRRFDSLNNTDMDYSIPSSPRVIDINFDGLADYLFVGDTGGQVWRLDFINATANDDFEMHGGVIAEFSDIGAVNNRRFHYEPDIAVLTDENNQQYLNIALGSGWRASPLNQVVEDRMYVFRDYDVFGPPRDDTDSIEYTTINEDDLFDATNNDTSADTTDSFQTGFYITMQEPGEKIVSTGFTINSNLLFSSYLPGTDIIDPCQASVGSSRFFAVDARNGKSILNLDGELTDEGNEELNLTDRFVNLNSPGIAPGPLVLIPDGNKDPFVLVGLEQPDGSEGLDIGNTFRRTFWAQPENLDE